MRQGARLVSRCALLLALACGSPPEPVPDPVSGGTEPSVEPAPAGERFLGLALDTLSMPDLSTDFGTGESWNLSVGIGPEDQRAEAIVAGTAETVRAFATAIDPIQPLVLGETEGQQYVAHVQERGAEALGFFGATDDPGTGRVVRVSYQTLEPDQAPATWARLVRSFGCDEHGEGELVRLEGLCFRVPADEGRLTLIDPDAEMTLRLRLTRQPNPAAPLLEAGPDRTFLDRREQPHPIAEGAVLTTFAERGVGGDDLRTAVLLAPVGDGRTLVVHATQPDARFERFVVSLRLP